MDRCIASYISPLGDQTPWIEEHILIKKGSLTFDTMFWWMLIRYRLLSTTSDNVLTLKKASRIASMMSWYAINFSSILRYVIDDIAFGEATNYPFSCLIQGLYDVSCVPEI